MKTNQHFSVNRSSSNMALNKPSKIFISWSVKSPIQDTDKLVLTLKKLFTAVESISIEGKKVVVKTSYTSSNKTIEKKLKPFNGYVNWSRGGTLSAEQEEECDDIFATLGNLASPTSLKRKRKDTEASSDDEEEDRVKVTKVKKSFKVRRPIDDSMENSEQE